MELVGTIIAVLPAMSGLSQRTGNPWMSQDYVIEVPGQYPRRCSFKIIHMIISCVFIFVVYLWKIVRIGNKSKSNEAMNSKMFAYVSCIQSYSAISVMSYILFKL